MGKNTGKGNPAYDKAYALAVRVVKCCQYLARNKREYVLSRQLLRSGTSIGANVAEANGPISDADFSAKMSLAYKECKETQYWLNLLKDTGYLDQAAFDSMHTDADEVGAILFSIIRTTRIAPKG